MKTKHTPGPWPFEIVPNAKRGEHGAVIFEANARLGPIIAYIPKAIQTEVSLEANARLIAAAPENVRRIKGLALTSLTRID